MALKKKFRTFRLSGWECRPGSRQERYHGVCGGLKVCLVGRAHAKTREQNRGAQHDNVRVITTGDPSRGELRLLGGVRLFGCGSHIRVAFGSNKTE